CLLSDGSWDDGDPRPPASVTNHEMTRARLAMLDQPSSCISCVRAEDSRDRTAHHRTEDQRCVRPSVPWDGWGCTQASSDRCISLDQRTRHIFRTTNLVVTTLQLARSTIDDHDNRSCEDPTLSTSTMIRCTATALSAPTKA